MREEAGENGEVIKTKCHLLRRRRKTKGGRGEKMAKWRKSVIRRDVVVTISQREVKETKRECWVCHTVE